MSDDKFARLFQKFFKKSGTAKIMEQLVQADGLDTLTLSLIHQRKMDYEKWLPLIPPLSFKPDWQIKMSPPFAGAMITFLVFKGNRCAAVYLDCHNHLGISRGPYWEVSSAGNYAERCFIDESDRLIELIDEGLNHPMKGPEE